MLSDLTLPDVTRAPVAEVRTLQDRLLRQTIALCYEAHPYYGRLMRREGLEPRHIATCDDLVRLPPTGKADFLDDPEAFRLDPAKLPPEIGTIWKMIYTSGTTTGRPAPLAVTNFDHHAFLYDIQRRQDLVGVGRRDIIANLFPLTDFPMGAYSRAADEAAACGAAIVFAHTGRPHPTFPVHHGLDDAVRLAEGHRATILSGIAGFVRRVLVRAEELGTDLTSVRMLVVTGEASSDAMLDDMRARMRRLGCAGERIINRYGCTEQGSSMLECTPGSGFHDLAPDQFFYEILDQATGERVPDGQEGMIAFSHLIRRGTVFLRYKMGDVVRLSRDPCPHCGRTSPRVVSQPVRTGDIVKIKGMLVNLQVLKDALERLPGVHEYQIVVQSRDPSDPFAHDELLVRLAVASGEEAAAAAEVERETVRVAQIRGRVEFLPADAIFDPASGTKPRRVVDLRTR